MGWAEARQPGVCILQALPGCSPGLWGTAPARAWLKRGFQTGLSLLHSQGSQKQCLRWSEEEKGLRQPQPPACPYAFSIAAEAVCPRADCDLLWWDEPYNNKITSLPQGTRHRVHPHPSGPCWECSLSLRPMGLTGMQDKCFHTPLFSLSTTH